MRLICTTVVLCLATALCVLGCDSAEELCPTEPGADQESYFPHEMGRQWHYAFEEAHSSQNAPWSDLTQGSLTWEIVRSEDHCVRIDLEVAERFAGIFARSSSIPELDTTYAVAWEKTLRARLEGDLLFIEGYIDSSYRALDSVRWMYPQHVPPVVEVDSTVFCGFGGCVSERLKLQRGVGIVEWEYANSGSGRELWTKTLTLQQEP